MSESTKLFEMMGREELLRALEMFAKNWLAHDGSWFLAAEERFGMDAAIELDACSWARFAAVEARRIMTTFDIPPAGGLPALEKALSLLLAPKRCIDVPPLLFVVKARQLCGFRTGRRQRGRKRFRAPTPHEPKTKDDCENDCEPRNPGGPPARCRP